MNESESTKNLGTRRKVAVRLGPAVVEAAEAIARLVAVPENVVYNLGVCMLAAQFAPLIASHGLSLDILEEEMRTLLDDARRVVPTKPAPSRKSAK